MNESQAIKVRNQTDIIEARMRVRTLARTLGLDLFDQARISLATSTLAIIFGLDRTGQGLITMGKLEREGRVGVKVVLTTAGTSLHNLTAGVLDDAKRMVDELTLETLPSGETQVTLLKWVGGRHNLASSSPLPQQSKLIEQITSPFQGS
jgi:hypothetical protein